MSKDNPAQISRRDRRRILEKKRKRLRKRRRTRVRRVRFYRSIRTARFWTRVSLGSVVLLAVVFWSKFAFVYDIPSYAKLGPLNEVQAYITVKPWWFGPPVFNLNEYANGGESQLTSINNPYQYLVLSLGRYATVITAPSFIWVQRG